MELSTLKYAGVPLLFVMALIGGAFPWWFLRGIETGKRTFWLAMGNCFTGGIFLGVGMLHMLPDAIDGLSKHNLSASNGHYPLDMLLASLGFVITFFCERVLVEGGHSALIVDLAHHDDADDDHPHHSSSSDAEDEDSPKKHIRGIPEEEEEEEEEEDEHEDTPTVAVPAPQPVRRTGRSRPDLTVDVRAAKETSKVGVHAKRESGNANGHVRAKTSVQHVHGAAVKGSPPPPARAVLTGRALQQPTDHRRHHTVADIVVHTVPVAVSPQSADETHLSPQPSSVPNNGSLGVEHRRPLSAHSSRHRYTAHPQYNDALEVVADLDFCCGQDAAPLVLTPARQRPHKRVPRASLHKRAHSTQSWRKGYQLEHKHGHKQHKRGHGHGHGHGHATPFDASSPLLASLPSLPVPRATDHTRVSSADLMAAADGIPGMTRVRVKYYSRLFESGLKTGLNIANALLRADGSHVHGAHARALSSPPPAPPASSDAQPPSKDSPRDKQSADDEEQGGALANLIPDVHVHDMVPSRSAAVWPFVIMAILSLHAFLAGVALGTSDEEDEIVVILVVLCFHKATAALSLGIVFIKARLHLSWYIKLIVVFAFSTPAGLGLGILLFHLHAGGTLLSSLVMAVAAGTFIYIAIMANLVEEFVESRVHRWTKFGWFMLGFIVMAAVAVLD